jgi:hypothetical protein
VPRPSTTPQPATTSQPEAPGWGFSIRASGPQEPLIDATFDLELRGGQPAFTVSDADARATEWALLTTHDSAALCFAREADGIDVPSRFRIESGGLATHIVVESGNPRARRCLADRLQQVRFPDPGSARHFLVDYVFHFGLPESRPGSCRGGARAGG